MQLKIQNLLTNSLYPESMSYSGIQNGSKLSRAGNDAGFDIAEIAKRVAEQEAMQEAALAQQIEQEFEDAIQGSLMEDTAALAALGQTAMRLGAAGLTSTVHAVTTRIEEAAARKTAAQADAFDPREERNRNDRKDRDEELLRDFRQDARQALRQMQEEQERQRAERETQKIGDVEMSRADWGRLASALQNDERHRNWFIQHFLQQGLSREEAERRTKIIQDAAAAADKPPETRTPADWDAIRRAEETPGVGNAVTLHAQNERDGYFATEPKAEIASLGESAETGAASRLGFFASGKLGSSVAASADSEGGIAAVGSITTSFNNAATGMAEVQSPDQRHTAQLVAEKPVRAAPTPALGADGLA
jgi:hypothetical protein